MNVLSEPEGSAPPNLTKVSVSMEEIKAFANEEGVAVFTCPKCKTTKTADVRQYQHLQKAVRARIRCACGHRFVALVERRKHYRKQVNLNGMYILKPGSTEGPITIRDISRTGIHFIHESRMDFEVGTRMMVAFQLDDKQRTEIRKEVIIRNVSGAKIGAEFYTIDPQNVYDKALGFYMMFNK